MSSALNNNIFKSEFKAIANSLEAVVEKYVQFYEDLERDDYFNEYADNQIGEVACNLFSILTSEGWDIAIQQYDDRSHLNILKDFENSVVGITSTSSEMRFRVMSRDNKEGKLDFCSCCEVDTFDEYPLFTTLLQTYLAKIDKYRLFKNQCSILPIDWRDENRTHLAPRAHKPMKG